MLPGPSLSLLPRVPSSLSGNPPEPRLPASPLVLLVQATTSSCLECDGSLLRGPPLCLSLCPLHGIQSDGIKLSWLPSRIYSKPFSAFPSLSQVQILRVAHQALRDLAPHCPVGLASYFSLCLTPLQSHWPPCHACSCLRTFASTTPSMLNTLYQFLLQFLAQMSHQ